MIAIDEAALECDLAETYHIYDYRALPPTRVALFSIGLRENSRIKMKISGTNYPLETMLTACIVDRLSILVWSKTKDGEKSRNRPKQIVGQMLGKQEEKEVLTFKSAEKFEDALKEINGEGVK